MYVVTGAAGFIGSALLAHLNQQGVSRVIAVDELGSAEKWKNLRGKRFEDFVHKDRFLELVEQDRLPADVKAIVHLGACSYTTETDLDYLMENNYRYSRVLAECCLKKNVRFIYASSAATYGDGALGYDDDESKVDTLLPLNGYGYSKQIFDQWAVRSGTAQRMVGLKFFNVFGPNEYHKAGQFSVVYTAFRQASSEGTIRLFKSYLPAYGDGEQRRDFVYVKDCVEVIEWLLEHREVHGIYNLGTGSARSFNELARAVFAALGKAEKIQYIEMPEALRQQYQYFTQATMNKLRTAGYQKPFRTLESGVRDYCLNYLAKPNPYW